MSLRIRSSLLFFLCVFSLNISHEISKTPCGGVAETLNARVRYDNATNTSESIFIGCITGSNITRIDLLSRVSTIEANTVVNMPILREIYMVDKGIRFLKPGFLKNTPKLTEFSGVRNKIASIQKDTFNHLNLDNLWLDSNEISSIEAGAFANLKLHWLSLSNNRLTEINGSWFHDTWISRLNLNSNGITSLTGDAFEELEGLTRLRLRENKIHFIDDVTFSDLPRLRSVDLRLNVLNSIDFLNGTMIEDIDLSFNMISSMVMDESVKIKQVVIYPNPWNCKCLMKFWEYAWKHRVKYSHAYVNNTESRLVCVVHGDNCDSNYSDPEVYQKYFKFVNYTNFKP